MKERKFKSPKNRDQVLQACNMAFENNKANFSIFKVLIQYNEGLIVKFH